MTLYVKQQDGETVGYANVVEVEVKESGSLQIISQTSDGNVFNCYAKHEWKGMEAKSI